MFYSQGIHYNAFDSGNKGNCDRMTGILRRKGLLSPASCGAKFEEREAASSVLYERAYEAVLVLGDTNNVDYSHGKIIMGLIRENNEIEAGKGVGERCQMLLVRGALPKVTRIFLHSFFTGVSLCY